MNPSLRNITRGVLISCAIAAILILAVRAMVGPFRLWGSHVVVNSPFVSENVVWIAVFVLLCLFREPAVSRGAGNPARFPRIYLTAVLCVVALAFAHNVADPFLSDDYIILNTPAFHWTTFLAGFHRPGGDGAFRPLGIVYYQMVKMFAGASPVTWHLTGLGLHLLNTALVFVMAWRLWRERTSATVAGLVFGLHGTRPEAALWTAGNWDLLAAACLLASLCLTLSPRTNGRRGRLAASLLLVAAGVLCKESAYASPLIALALMLAQPAGQVRENMKSFLIGSVVVCGALFAWRWRLFHGPGGYIDPATGHSAILSLHAIASAKALSLRIWAILLAPINWDAPVSWWLPLSIAASLGGLLFIVSTSRCPGGRRLHFCLMAATAFSVLPAIHLALIGQAEMGSRILYLAGAPFALLIGSLISGTRRRDIAIAAIMLAGMTGILEHNLGAWHRAALQAQRLCHEAIARPGVPGPGTFEGVVLFQNGFSECTAAARSAE